MSAVSQPGFTQALFDPTRPVPEGLVDPQGRRAGKRFDVYRNNVTLSLIEALKKSFPAIHSLLGEDNFSQLAVIFLRAHPPKVPILMYYGDEMPAFLEGFAPLASYPWMGDLARLEQAIRESYHAADASPIEPARLQNLPPERLLAARLTLAPSLRLIRSRWPVLSLRRRQLEDGAPEPEPRGEAVLITRPEFDPVEQLLPPGGATFILALQDGARFGDAFDRAQSAIADFDLSAVLAMLTAGGAITDLTEPNA